MLEKLFIKSRIGATILLLALTLTCFSKVGFAEDLILPSSRAFYLTAAKIEFTRMTDGTVKVNDYKRYIQNVSEQERDLACALALLEDAAFLGNGIGPSSPRRGVGAKKTGACIGKKNAAALRNDLCKDNARLTLLAEERIAIIKRGGADIAFQEVVVAPQIQVPDPNQAGYILKLEGLLKNLRNEISTLKQNEQSNLKRIEELESQIEILNKEIVELKA
ncbi:MAG: hypothetical protein LBD61_05715, partial [Endomicrobium sp.]|nr:hypothetical protein [Endomicrobium sp.]